EIKELLQITPMGLSKQKKLSGWLRLGIALSILWLFVSTSVYVIGIRTYPSRLISSTGMYRLYAWVERSNHSPPWNDFVRKPGEDYQKPADQFWQHDAMMFPEPDGVRFAWFALSPLICGWLLLFVLP